MNVTRLRNVHNEECGIEPPANVIELIETLLAEEKAVGQVSL